MRKPPTMIATAIAACTMAGPALPLAADEYSDEMSFDEVTELLATTSDAAEAIFDVSIELGSSVPGCQDTNSCHLPFVAVITVGETVRWTNNDTAAHTVTSGSIADGLSGVFDSGLFFSGETFTHTFESTGTFEYFDLVHPWATGFVQVNPVPEPAAAALLGLPALALLSRSRKQGQQPTPNPSA